MNVLWTHFFCNISEVKIQKKMNTFISESIHIRIILSKSLNKKNIPNLVTMSKIYSQLAEKWHAFVLHFTGRTFYVSAVAKIMDPINT